MTTLYRFYDAADQLIYIGVTDSPMRRFAEHGADRPWWQQATTIRLEHFPTREQAEQAEREAIRTEYPPANIAHRLPLVWETLTVLEPQLLDLLDECRRSTDPLADWYGHTGTPGIRTRLAQLVGLGATDPDGNPRPAPLGDDRTYELCYRHLFDAAYRNYDRWSA